MRSGKFLKSIVKTNNPDKSNKSVRFHDEKDDKRMTRLLEETNALREAEQKRQEKTTEDNVSRQSVLNAHLQLIEDASDLKLNDFIDRVNGLPPLLSSEAKPVEVPETEPAHANVVALVLNRKELRSEEKLNVLKTLIDAKAYPITFLLSANVIALLLTQQGVEWDDLIYESYTSKLRESFSQPTLQEGLLWERLVKTIDSIRLRVLVDAFLIHRNQTRAFQFVTIWIKSFTDSSRLMKLSNLLISKFPESQQALLQRIIDTQIVKITLDKAESKVEVTIAGKPQINNDKKISAFLQGHRDATSCWPSKTPSEDSFQLIRKNKLAEAKAKNAEQEDSLAVEITKTFTKG